jgi:hypothetical protein
MNRKGCGRNEAMTYPYVLTLQVPRGNVVQHKKVFIQGNVFPAEKGTHYLQNTDHAC